MNTLDKAKIEITIGRFNFHRVHEVMTSINWTWHNENVPTIESLQTTAWRLLKDAYKEAQLNKGKSATIATGGFVANYSKDMFFLSFVLAESDSYIDEEDEPKKSKTKKRKTPPNNDSFSHLEI